MSERRGNRIFVPTRTIQGGFGELFLMVKRGLLSKVFVSDAPIIPLFVSHRPRFLSDFKFETDPYNVKLHDLMTPEQYTEAMENLNQKLKPSRSGKADGVLLAAGPLLVPLAVWGVRHRNQTRRRKRLLKDGIHEFNMQYQELLMRWNRSPDSALTIERRHPTDTSATTAEQEAIMAHAHATLVPDAIDPTTMALHMTGSVLPQPQPAVQRSTASEPTSSGLV